IFFAKRRRKGARRNVEQAAGVRGTCFYSGTNGGRRKKPESNRPLSGRSERTPSMACRLALVPDYERPPGAGSTNVGGRKLRTPLVEQYRLPSSRGGANWG